MLLTLNVISWCADSKTSFLANCCLPFPVDDVQVSCYRILNSLYVLGTNKSIYVERYYMSGDTFLCFAFFQCPLTSQDSPHTYHIPTNCIKPCPDSYSSTIHSFHTDPTPLPCRQRPALGKCLAAFSAAFPVAFLEHQINRFNSFSIYNSRGAKDRAGAVTCVFISTLAWTKC